MPCSIDVHFLVLVSKCSLFYVTINSSFVFPFHLNFWITPALLRAQTKINVECLLLIQYTVIVTVCHCYFAGQMLWFLFERCKRMQNLGFGSVPIFKSDVHFSSVSDNCNNEISGYWFTVVQQRVWFSAISLKPQFRFSLDFC